MELTLRSRNQRVLRKSERSFQWYDSVNKRMLVGTGGEMIFQYVPSQHRSVPYIVDRESWVSENDFDQLVDWVNRNTREFGIVVVDSARRHFMLIRIAADLFDDVSESLYRSRIMFDYDEAQLYRELNEIRRG
jgi:hypothetical protein